MATGEIYYSLPEAAFTSDDIEAIKVRVQLVADALAPGTVSYEVESDEHSSGVLFFTLILQQLAGVSAEQFEQYLQAVRSLFECADRADGLTIRLVRHMGGTAVIG